MTKTLEELKGSSERIAIIHYASTSIFVPPVEVTQISVRDFARDETRSFGHLDYPDEQAILKAWANHVESLGGYTFVGWNFHSQTYGLPALESRWNANSIQEQFPITSADVTDLDDSFVLKYGQNYVSGAEKLKHLADLNGVTTKDYVVGKDEPTLFARGDLQRLMMSTERKVAMIASLLALAVRGKFVTQKKARFMREISIVVVILLGLILAMGLYFRAIHPQDITAAITGVFVAAIISVLAWGWGLKAFLSRRFGS